MGEVAKRRARQTWQWQHTHNKLRILTPLVFCSRGQESRERRLGGLDETDRVETAQCGLTISHDGKT
jgi:hypothetical protein